MMHEFELIKRLIRLLPVNDSLRVGAGDDCAVIDLGIPNRDLLFKTDAVVEGIHFDPDAKPEKIGHKALARCLSDIAAMAGTPAAALITLGLPPTFDPARVESIYRGMASLARRYDVALSGGETTTSPERLFLSVSVVGWVDRGRAVLRSGAKEGDALFVTGELGGSRGGWHLEFEPRLAEARWLATQFDVHAMIDLSDGLAGDLQHVLEASHTGAELLSRAIPISRSAKLAGKVGSSVKPPLLAALTDGEDFELLFAIPGPVAVPLLDAWKRRFPALRLSCIGKVNAEPGIRIRDAQGVRPITAHGYVHFT